MIANHEHAPEVARAEQAKAAGSARAEESGERPGHAESALKTLPILFEGDETSSAFKSGPGQKYALGPAAGGGLVAHEEAALPEAYGTGKLRLAARDPHWLYAHWDLTLSQQRHYNTLSADHHLVIRVCPPTVMEQPIREVHVHPESRHWFIHVDRAETQCVAELGYYRPGGEWVGVATSPPAVTPAETISTDQTVRFATIPPHVRLSQLAALAKPTAAAELPPSAATLPPMEAARERALAELIGLPLVREEWISSAEMGEVVRGRGEEEISGAQMVQPAPAGGEAGNVSSPLGAPEQRPERFWFSINADLILYGATEPGATVTIGGRPIQLRPDGTFSCRFSLPEGEHAVTLSALSARGDLRQAELRLSRQTDYQGEVAPAPQDQSLEPPEAESP